MIMLADEWKDYEILSTGDGYKLERWGEIFLLRPDPQVIWKAKEDIFTRPEICATYRRSEKGGGAWEYKKKIPESWTVSYKDLKFKVMPMGFKHTGLFPEQAAHWDKLRALIERRAGQGKPTKVLNLFAYTGGASVAMAKSGALVTHVDAAKGMVERAGENARLSGITSGIRYIIDDCKKFVLREQKRGNFYDGIVMDPPSYGRGPGGEMWKIETELFSLVSECSKLLSKERAFFLINSYTTGLSPTVLENILRICLPEGGEFSSYEVGLKTREKIILPCGAGGICVYD